MGFRRPSRSSHFTNCEVNDVVMTLVVPAISARLRSSLHFYIRRRNQAMSVSRREFLIGTASTTLAARSEISAIGVDYEFKMGYHAITWGENTEQAIDEISELGFRGIQIRRADWEKYA